MLRPLLTGTPSLIKALPRKFAPKVNFNKGKAAEELGPPENISVTENNTISRTNDDVEFDKSIWSRIKILIIVNRELICSKWNRHRLRCLK